MIAIQVKSESGHGFEIEREIVASYISGNTVREYDKKERLKGRAPASSVRKTRTGWKTSRRCMWRRIGRRRS